MKGLVRVRIKGSFLPYDSPSPLALSSSYIKVHKKMNLRARFKPDKTRQDQAREGRAGQEGKARQDKGKARARVRQG